tara:strand:+ start:45166 stop:45918 length:753 start_codon:yes stop_codon:yes gene_type:complete
LVARIRLIPEIVAGLIMLVVLMALTDAQLAPEQAPRLWYFSLGIILYGLATSIVCVAWFRQQIERRQPFGWANRVTLLRMVMTVLLAAMVPFMNASDFAEGGEVILSYGLIGIATCSLLLDGVDGFIARQMRQSSAFGARFDMEVDAAFILVLCLLLWRLEIAQPWVLAIGLMRYAFVTAALLLPVLNGQLAPSLRRKTICVVQVVSLIVCLHPLLNPAAAQMILGTALVLLASSFAKDIWDLLGLRQNR